MNYIVIQIDLDYDYCMGAGFVEGFEAEDEADAFIAEKRALQDAAWKARCDYIEGWVDAIEVPEKVCPDDWQKFLKKYGYPGRVSPSSFKNMFKNYLRQYGTTPEESDAVGLKDYKPPYADFQWSELHVVNLKEKRYE